MLGEALRDLTARLGLAEIYAFGSRAKEARALLGALTGWVRAHPGMIDRAI